MCKVFVRALCVYRQAEQFVLFLLGPALLHLNQSMTTPVKQSSTWPIRAPTEQKQWWASQAIVIHAVG